MCVCVCMCEAPGVCSQQPVEGVECAQFLYFRVCDLHPSARHSAAWRGGGGGHIRALISSPQAHKGLLAEPSEGVFVRAV